MTTTSQEGVRGSDRVVSSGRWLAGTGAQEPGHRGAAGLTAQDATWTVPVPAAGTGPPSACGRRLPARGGPQPPHRDVPGRLGLRHLHVAGPQVGEHPGGPVRGPDPV